MSGCYSQMHGKKPFTRTSQSRHFDSVIGRDKMFLWCYMGTFM